jgi:hypothetical protein
LPGLFLLRHRSESDRGGLTGAFRWGVHGFRGLPCSIIPRFFVPQSRAGNADARPHSARADRRFQPPWSHAHRCTSFREGQG